MIELLVLKMGDNGSGSHVVLMMKDSGDTAAESDVDDD